MTQSCSSLSNRSLLLQYAYAAAHCVMVVNSVDSYVLSRWSTTYAHIFVYRTCTGYYMMWIEELNASPSRPAACSCGG